MSQQQVYKPEATALDGGDRGGVLYLVDTDGGWRNVGELKLTAEEWRKIAATPELDHLFSGQVAEVTWEAAEHQVRAVFARGFDKI